MEIEGVRWRHKAWDEALIQAAKGLHVHSAPSAQ